MSKEERIKIRKRITILSFALLGAIIAFLIFTAVNKEVPVIVFNVVVSAFLIMYWILLDIVEPRLLHQFDGISQERMSAYYKYIAIDLIGYAGIAYFIFTIGAVGGNGIFGALVYVFSISFKRRFKDAFDGVQKTEEPVALDVVDAQTELLDASDVETENLESEESED